MRAHNNSHLPRSLFISIDGAASELLPGHPVAALPSCGAVPTPSIPCLTSMASPLSKAYLIETYELTKPVLGLHYKSVERKVT